MALETSVWKIASFGHLPLTRHRSLSFQPVCVEVIVCTHSSPVESNTQPYRRHSTLLHARSQWRLCCPRPSRTRSRIIWYRHCLGSPSLRTTNRPTCSNRMWCDVQQLRLLLKRSIQPLQRNALLQFSEDVPSS